MIREYWVGSAFVVEWTIIDGAGAAVTGTVATPSGPAEMGLSAAENVFTATHQPSEPGTHAWKLQASGVVVGVEEGTFVVQRDKVGLPPITVDAATDVGMIRLLATDLDEVSPLFTDAQIAAFLAVEGGNVKRAAALACETTAVSELLTSKKITTGDGLQTDGPAVAKELRERAATLRAQAQKADDDAAEAAYGLEIVALWSFPAAPSWGDQLL